MSAKVTVGQGRRMCDAVCMFNSLDCDCPAVAEKLRYLGSPRTVGMSSVYLNNPTRVEQKVEMSRNRDARLVDKVPPRAS